MSFKARIKSLESTIKVKKKELEAFKKKEAQAKSVWTKENRAFRDAATQLASLTVFGTKKHERLKKRSIQIGQPGRWLLRARAMTIAG